MNKFLLAAKRAVARNKTVVSYLSVSEDSYNTSTLTTTNTETSHSVDVAKRSIKTGQYNYPNLIGKEVNEYYLANDDLSFTPAVNDKITDSGVTYLIYEVFKEFAGGDLVLYRLIAVKG